MKHDIYSVKNFRITGAHSLEITFNDGQKKNINFEPVLKGEMYGPLANAEYFRKVFLDPEVHTIVWPNGADFDPEVLHNWDTYIEELGSRAKSWKSTQKV